GSRANGQPWRIWRGPAELGAVNRITLNKQSVIAIHDRARRFSRFEITSGTWQAIGDQRGIDLGSELLIRKDDVVLRKALGSAFDESALLALRVMHDGSA